MASRNIYDGAGTCCAFNLTAAGTAKEKISDDDGSCDETLEISLLFSEELSAQTRKSSFIHSYDFVRELADRAVGIHYNRILHKAADKHKCGGTIIKKH